MVSGNNYHAFAARAESHAKEIMDCPTDLEPSQCLLQEMQSKLGEMDELLNRALRNL